MAEMDPHQGRVSEEAPRLLALEPWIRGARVLWLGAAAEESVEWLHRLGATRVSVVGSKVPGGLRADVYLEPDGLSAVPSHRTDLVIAQDFGARLAAEPDLFNDLDRLLSPEGRVVGILPSEGVHVGVDMVPHRDDRQRLDYGQVVDLLEDRFEHVTAVAQVPLLGYLMTGTSEDRSLQFDGRLADLAQEPPIYHLVAGFRTPPELLANRIATLSFDHLSDRVGQVVASLAEKSNAVRLDANRGMAQLEQRLERAQRDVLEAQQAQAGGAKTSKRLERQRDALKADLVANRKLAQDLESQLGERQSAIDEAADQAEQMQRDAARWEGRAEEFLRLSLRLQNEQAELQETLRAERAARQSDPIAHDLVVSRVAHQTLAASAHRLSQTAERRRKETAELLGQLRRAQSQQRQGEDLLREAQTRLEAHAQAPKGAGDGELLEHLRGQLSEALSLEESLDEERRNLQKELAEAESQNSKLSTQIDELEKLRPRLTELEDHARLLKERLQAATAANETGEERLASHSVDLEAALEREALLKARSIELAEAVSNLAARVDLLETEASDRVETIAVRERARDALQEALDEERILNTGLRQQLDEANTALQAQVVDDETEALRREVTLVNERYQASLEALQQQGTEAAHHEEEHRRLELENQRLRASNLARKSEPSDRVAELQQRIKNLDEERQRLEGELSSLQAKSDQQAHRIEHMEQVQDELKTLRSDRSVLTAEVERLTPFEAASAQLDKLHQEKETTLADLAAQLLERQGLCEELRDQLSDAKVAAEQARSDSADQVQAARRDLQTRLAEAEANQRESSLRSDQLDSELEALKAEHEALQTRQELLADERDGLNGRIAQLMTNQADLLEQQTQTDQQSNMSVAEHAQKLADAQAVELELRRSLQATQDNLDEALAARLSAEENQRGGKSELATIKAAAEQAETSVRNLEAELARAEEHFEEQREEMAKHHDAELQQRLDRAADVQQATINKLETELADLRGRSASIQAQEDRILQMVEEQRHAADRAWDLAIAQRTARFAALIDRFDQVVHATIQKEGRS